MYFWLKAFHIAAMLVWFIGLVFLPRLLLARRRRERDARGDGFDAMARTLYLHVATPAGVLTIVLGMALIAHGPQGAWLVMKLALVLVAVLLHLHLGVLLYQLRLGTQRHGVFVLRTLTWLPVLVMLGVAALTGAKPDTAGDLPAPPQAGPER